MCRLQWKRSKPAALFITSINTSKSFCSCHQSMAAASSGRAEVDTSRAFRSVKEAVAVFGECILASEAKFRPGVRADRRVVPERSSWQNAAAAIAASNAKFESSDGVEHSGLLIMESQSKPNSIANAKHEGGSSRPTSNPKPALDAVSMCLVPSSPPFFASSPSLANDDDDDYQDLKEADLMIISSIKKVEEEAAKTRQEVVQLKKRLAETELAMANLNAKLHRALSKLAHMEADKAAAARASIQQRDGNIAALTVWAEPRPPRQQLGHLLSLDDADGEEEVHGQRREQATRKTVVQKQKPIVPLAVPLINHMLFSKKKRIKDKETLYMKELYSLLSLT